MTRLEEAEFLMDHFLMDEDAGATMQLSRPHVIALVNEISSIRGKNAETWTALESVCIGEKMTCEVCGKYHPCMCDK